MFHIVGVTPEAPTLETALGGNKPEDRFTFGRKERRESYQDLCFGTDTKVDMVLIGCPHCTLQQIHEIADMLKGNKINKDTRLWIGTSEVTRSLAERAGLVDIIEGGGAVILSDMCTRAPAIPPLSQALGIGTLATTSCSIAENAIRRSRGKTTTWFGTTKDCIQASITGLWEGE